MVQRKFANVKNSVEPVMFQLRKYGFGEGWMAALVAAGVLEDSPLKNPDQVPYTVLPTAFRNTKSQNTKSLICTPLLYCQASFFDSRSGGQFLILSALPTNPTDSTSFLHYWPKKSSTPVHYTSLLLLG